jgi:hypothetical protein
LLNRRFGYQSTAKQRRNDDGAHFARQQRLELLHESFAMNHRAAAVIAS